MEVFALCGLVMRDAQERHFTRKYLVGGGKHDIHARYHWGDWVSRDVCCDGIVLIHLPSWAGVGGERGGWGQRSDMRFDVSRGPDLFPAMGVQVLFIDRATLYRAS